MKTWNLRLGLSLLLVVGFWSSRLPAQEPIPQPKAIPNQTPQPVQILVMPSVEYAPAYVPSSPPAFALPPQYPPSDHHLKRFLNNHGMGCGVNQYPTCGNWRYEARFIFGSCRSFFNDSCPPGSPFCGQKR
jgi:hypothetical protein